MCLLAICFHHVPDAPVLVAANREEFFDRPSLPPRVQPSRPRVICGIDQRAGGTWLGVNQYGVLVGVTNRPKTDEPAPWRSRGTLCRELLKHRTADEAAEHARLELATGRYRGANYVCVDQTSAAIIHGGDSLETIRLEPGWHIIANGDVNDPLDRRANLARRLFTETPITEAAEFVARAKGVCSHRKDPACDETIVLRAADRGTVSSTLIALTGDPTQSRYLYAARSPDLTDYDDYSAQLVEVLTSTKPPRGD